MDVNRKNSNETLDAVIEAVRSSEPDRTDMENAAARVWSRIGQELQIQGREFQGRPPEFLNAKEFGGPSLEFASLKLQSCVDYRGLIPEYVAGSLTSARA